MAAIEDLLKQIGDARLRERIAQEWEQATRHKKFGLVFEQHLPEVVPIYSAKPRRGDLVAKRNGSLSETWRIRRVANGMASLVKPKAAGEKESTADRVILPLDDLLVVKQFGDPIFPTLVPMDAVQNGPADAPWHTLIEADNYHALQLLEYLYAGKVDCIYIDPPYNSGAKDWKYNNNYVDGKDAWRHSKWLSFVERRLEIARRVINQEDGVIIVAIDEKEYAHLSCLLVEMFPEARIQMVSILINPAGVARAGAFSRSDEYLFFVMFGKCTPQKVRLSRDWVSTKGRTHTGDIRWDLLRRSGTGARRSDSPGCFFPIYVDPKTRSITHVGEALPDGEKSAPTREGEVAILPFRKDKSEGRWQWNRQTFLDRKKQGRVAIGGNEKRGFTVYILKDGEFEKIENGQFLINGYDENGGVIVERSDATFVTAVPHSQWRVPEHDATQYGTRLLAKILPNSSFPFPKSIYAVRDALRFFVVHKPDALVLDFFAGSGTTLSAVQLLNAADGGSRRCIIVTNNEVSAEEAETFISMGLSPASDEWEAAGICRSVTWPRITLSTRGLGSDGKELAGEYLTGRVIESEKRRTFRHVAFLSPDMLRVPEGLSDKDRAKAVKRIHRDKLAFVAVIDGLPQTAVTPGSDCIVSEDHKASVLFDPAALEPWLDALDGNDHITDFYIVAESEKQFKAIKAQVEDLLGPLLVPEGEKRPMSAGFPANVAYFKLDFLEKDRVELGAAFREILPLLWMKAGAIGPVPTLPAGDLPDHLIPPYSPFAVLLEETRIVPFSEALVGRRGLTHVFIVTDAEEAFRMLTADLRAQLLPDNPDVEFVQLYRDYLVNFTINTRTADTPLGAEGAA